MSAYSQKRTFEHLLSSMDSLHQERYALGPGRGCVERRLAAILAADVVGYSRLMEADEEATARTLSTYREIIERLVASHHGRVFGSSSDRITSAIEPPMKNMMRLKIRYIVPMSLWLVVYNQRVKPLAGP